eukprot:4255087-Prymnesium_polylepis.1
MAQGCAAALVRSGERGWHAVYLQSAVHRLERTPTTACFYPPNSHVARRHRGHQIWSIVRTAQNKSPLFRKYALRRAASTRGSTLPFICTEPREKRPRGRAGAR